MSIATPADLYSACREVLRLRHLSYRTEQTYLGVIRRYIAFHGNRSPEKTGVPEIRAFLSHLATQGNVAASTQNVAFSALLFLYKDVLKIPLPEITGVERAQRSRRLPSVLSQDETRHLLDSMSGTPRLMAQLLYGAGLRQPGGCGFPASQRTRSRPVPCAYVLSLDQGSRQLFPHRTNRSGKDVSRLCSCSHRLPGGILGSLRPNSTSPQ